MRYAAMAWSITTQRLCLQLRDECDAEWNHELLGEHEGGTALSVDDVRRRLAEQRIRAFGNGIGLLTIRRRVDGEPLGYCGLIIGRCSLDEPEIAYELLKRFHGHGYATEAAHAVMGAAFATGRTRIWSTVGAWNAPSLRVLEKLGFDRHHETTDDLGRPLVYLVREAEKGDGLRVNRCEDPGMPADPAVRLRAATAADQAFVIEMARHACVIEDWPLPDPDDDEVLGMLPAPGEVPIIAEDLAGEPVGAVWTWHNDPPLRVDASGASVPELCIGVAPGRRGAGIGGMLLDALFARCAQTMDVMCTNVHLRNPARHLYRRKGFKLAGQGRGPLGLAMIKEFG
ncbi:hypothetical protein hbim_00601 [Mycolicibacterium mageritense]|uniref:N-acetyltransferase domain-containing protein n=2 Tax=Mycolicibacterium mageritense TaxID=53462 RepID=A0AAI8TPX6_MYCME|nr:hypothetical protein hbim_00601 [Mycolicibacterium mageritense]